MFTVIKVEDNTYKFSYMRIINLDVVQCVKYDLEQWEVAQYMGGN